MSKPLFAITILLLAAVACNWSDIAPLAAPEIEPSPLPTFAINTLTAVPSETPLPTLTSTPETPIAWSKEQAVNCRYGPGQNWEVVSSLPVDTITAIKGRSVDTAWLYISDPVNPGSFCWVLNNAVETAGDINAPIVDAPMASVTDVSVEAVVAFSACGTSNDVTFNASISTNGPATVIYNWDVSGDATVSSADESIQFTETGTQKVSTDFFSADCGNYSVKLLVTSPDTASVKKAFTIQAP